ncbi:MAG: FHA domain-containing protein [Thermoplasmatota archaeon]
MGLGGADKDVDFDELESYLKVLAYANRLELLSLLRAPKTLDEVRLTPGSSQAAGNPERQISRQAVQNHLDRLIEAGLVRVRLTDRKGKRSVQEYVVDHSRLFALVEELRKVSTLESFVPLDPFATIQMGSAAETKWMEGAKLVIVHGVHEGKAFALQSKEMREGRGWVIGRKGDANVSLEYDPFVSMENAEIIRNPDNTYKLLDLRNAKNGTFLNWNRLAVGGEAQLKSGDVIGVGRSLLVFREA